MPDVIKGKRLQEEDIDEKYVERAKNTNYKLLDIDNMLEGVRKINDRSGEAGAGGVTHFLITDTGELYFIGPNVCSYAMIGDHKDNLSAELKDEITFRLSGAMFHKAQYLKESAS